jgi:hypothetical protein
VRFAENVCQPHQRHPIGRDESSLLVNLPQRGITIALDDTVDAGHADVARRSLGYPTADRRNRVGHS